MKKIGLTFTVLALLVHYSFVYADVYADIEPVENKPHWQAQVFIANQIKGIGLVDSYQEDGEDRSYVYDNALAAIASMAMGNFGLAKEILDTLCNEVNNSLQDVPFESYNFSKGVGGGISNAGNTAWLLQALNIYQKKQKGREYYDIQKKLADFLVKLQDNKDGALRGSNDEYWKSTEHNIIAYVALKNFGRLNRDKKYVGVVNKIRAFLLSSSIWNGTYFSVGLPAPGEVQRTVKVTDTQALGVLLFGSAYSSALNWAESNLKFTDYGYSPPVTGFDFDGESLDAVWLEGTLQMALAYHKVNNSSEGDSYYNEALKTTQSDGSLLWATKGGTAGTFYDLYPWRAIAPTSWLIFCSLKFNPLILY